MWGKLEQPVICVQPINHDVKPAKAVWRGTNAIPSWSWQGCEGRKAVVEVYTDAESVELKLNGKTLGTKKVRDCKATFKVKYAPGTLTTIAGGKSSKLISAGEAAIAVRPETTEAKPSEILYIPIAIADKHGVLESNADRSLSVSVEGGELLGFG